MKRVWSFPIGAFRSNFHRHLTERSSWESNADQSDWQLSSLAQVCGSSFPRALISAVEHLYILENIFRDCVGKTTSRAANGWNFSVHLPAVKGLYISQEFVPHIAPALQELVGERVTEVLPALQTLFLEETTPTRTCPGSYWAICCRTTACRSPHCCFSLGKKWVL